MMEAVSSSETSVSIYLTTQCNISKDSHLHTCHHENLKPQSVIIICLINGSVSSSDYIELNDRMINELERIWKEIVVA
jgi:hypothetical protein